MAPNDIALSYELTPQEIAEQLILNGFSPCPLEPMSKVIRIKNWPNVLHLTCRDLGEVTIIFLLRGSCSIVKRKVRLSC